MNTIGLDDVFSDLVDDDEELLAFLATMQALVPACELQLRTRAGVLPPGPPLGPDQAGEELFAAASHGPGPVAVAGTGQPLFALAVPRLDAVLLLRPETGADLAADPFLAALIRNAVELALLGKEREDLELENQQILRQIDVLNRQHHQLIEDNYRQYCQIQEREKGYARELETEIARRTAELREANARLEEASRLKSEFLANMSHELRTPLNAIIGFAELLAETELAGEQAEYAATIRSAADSLLALINEILDLAKIEAGKVELEKLPFAVTETVAMAGNLFRIPARGKGVTLAVSCDEGLAAPVLGDSHRLRQVLVNLLGNALKFTEQGRIELRAERAGGGEGEVAVRFSVQDSGIGIPPERQQAVFEKFTQADGSTTRKFGGTGLGLAICKQLVELMGGEISLVSAPGRGSTFSFTLPMALARGKSPAGEVATRTEPSLRSAPCRQAVVLLVEDNPVNQKLASILITKQNCKVIVAADGIEALDALREHECDLVLMDIQMPRLDGLAATRKIRELEASLANGEYAALRKAGPIPIIGLTAHARRQDEEACYEAGMNGFLTKPIVRDKLAALLRQFLS